MFMFVVGGWKGLLGSSIESPLRYNCVYIGSWLCSISGILFVFAFCAFLGCGVRMGWFRHVNNVKWLLFFLDMPRFVRGLSEGSVEVVWKGEWEEVDEHLHISHNRRAEISPPAIIIFGPDKATQNNHVDVLCQISRRYFTQIYGILPHENMYK